MFCIVKGLCGSRILFTGGSSGQKSFLERGMTETLSVSAYLLLASFGKHSEMGLPPLEVSSGGGGNTL